MASVRMQIFAAITEKLNAVMTDLDWQNVILNPRDPIGEDQMNALILATGGDAEPGTLTGHVETHVAELAVGLAVTETEGKRAEVLLDEGFVAVCDSLLDPNDIQLGGLAVDIRRGAVSPPYIGRGQHGARIVGVQEIEFSVSYWTREGDASEPGP